MKLEICANSLESALIAERAGADRIELCANLEIGGTTPSYATIALAKKKLSIPVYVLIRPRAGDFLYSEAEYDCMAKDIKLCKQLGCDGVVVGLLHPNGLIDKKRTDALVKLANPMGVTFHRAFDYCKDPLTSLEEIIEIGCERLLTSGQKASAMEGISLIQQLVERAKNRISIMPGAGINCHNIKTLMEQTKAGEFHCSAKTSTSSAMRYINDDLNDMGKQAGISNEKEIRAIAKSLQEKSR